MLGGVRYKGKGIILLGAVLGREQEVDFIQDRDGDGVTGLHEGFVIKIAGIVF
jgi:hypothetical protein